MKHVLHVHQQKLRSGETALIDRTYKGSTHARVIKIHCPDCHTVAGKVVQSTTPDRCGARAWIECEVTSHAQED